MYTGSLQNTPYVKVQPLQGDVPRYLFTNNNWIVCCIPWFGL